MPRNRPRLHVPILALALGVCSPMSVAQARWAKVVVTSPGPGPLSAPQLVSEPTHLYLFGANVSGKTKGFEIWSFSGKNWTKLAVTTHPPLGPTAAVYDVKNKVIVALTSHPQTWVYDFKNWKQMKPSSSPTNRSQPAMIYDVKGQRVLLFGGGRLFNGLRHNDTWSWDGTNWTQLKPTTSPTARFQTAWAFDRLGRLILFGGATGTTSAVPNNDTWSFDGKIWRKLAPKTVPPVRYGHAMTYDSIRQRVVMHGGESRLGSRLGDTWEWDGADWTQRKNTGSPVIRTFEIPPAVFHGQFTFLVEPYGPSTSGSTGDLWVYQTDKMATVTAFGTACGRPAPKLVSATRPWLGDVFRAEATNMGSSGSSFFVFGISNATWSRTRLPLDMKIFGFPTCMLYVSVDSVIPVAIGAGGNAVFSSTIANSPTLVGTTTFIQAFSFPGSNAILGTVAIAGKIGVR